MIKVDNIEIWGFKHAIRGMRNPLNSWNKSDSVFDSDKPVIGANDFNLMKRLFDAGTEHRKYLRQIMVSMDITAPLYWWKEFDTYKIGTVANSCSTMHKVASKEFTEDDFSCEHLNHNSKNILKVIIKVLNDARDSFNETKDKDDWWQIIQLLPTSYNQKRTITMNYENIIQMIRQRSGHKLNEWQYLVKIFEHLPYISELLKERTE